MITTYLNLIWTPVYVLVTRLPLTHYLIGLFPLQTLIKKDRADQNDPTMGEFFDKLVTAYRDPIWMPIRHSPFSNEHNSPLLHSS